jgi:hypothetical protein
MSRTSNLSGSRRPHRHRRSTRAAGVTSGAATTFSHQPTMCSTAHVTGKPGHPRGAGSWPSGIGRSDDSDAGGWGPCALAAFELHVLPGLSPFSYPTCRSGSYSANSRYGGSSRCADNRVCRSATHAHRGQFYAADYCPAAAAAPGRTCPNTWVNAAGACSTLMPTRAPGRLHVTAVSLRAPGWWRGWRARLRRGRCR